MAHLDTSPDARELQMRVLKKMTSVERLKAALEFSELTQKLAFARIEQEQPGLSRQELVRKYLRCVLHEERYPAGLK